ncbi:helix-turn-helix transcriptional regulator [Mycobacterium sp. CnD-18-1]|uniref:helix-turn-helix domain-containing protein n=1 Tax=Mycobacterium sp. CnD-18-1 TaxID=2917744 RepID=UPI001EF30DAD|nr:helix-turn-helix transcriptional regulator [Mycobacterium sp. CnD-18-1]MCG7607185.1 helix-turn-helix transcriptional regulator [Mycobacterium sp. CnD-18-1]
MPILKFKPSGYDKLRKTGLIPTDNIFAERIQVDRSTVYRVLTGKTSPSSNFVAGVVDAFGAGWFTELFEAGKK